MPIQQQQLLLETLRVDVVAGGEVGQEQRRLGGWVFICKHIRCFSYDRKMFDFFGFHVFLVLAHSLTLALFLSPSLYIFRVFSLCFPFSHDPSSACTHTIVFPRLLILICHHISVSFSCSLTHSYTRTHFLSLSLSHACTHVSFPFGPLSVFLSLPFSLSPSIIIFIIYSLPLMLVSLFLSC